MAFERKALRISVTSKHGIQFEDVWKAVRGLAQDNARARVEVARTGFADVVDNTTGVVGTAIAAVALPTPFKHVTGNDCAPKAGFDTAIGKLGDVSAVVGTYLNPILAVLGLDPLVVNDGAVASAGTLPALDKTLTGNDGAGAIAVSAVTGRAELSKARSNQSLIIRALNEISNALGDATIANNTGGLADKTTRTLVNDAATAAGVDGTAVDSTLADSTVDAALTALANNYATIASHLNALLGQTGLADLTNNLGGGTASNELLANVVPAAADGAATTSSPKAGFDTQLGVIENNLSDLTLRTNLLRARYGLSLLTDSTGVSADTTIEVVSVNLAAVDGSSGTVAVDQVTGRARLTQINDALSSLTAAINELAPYFGVVAITDSLGGTVSTTIANLAATATGVSGVGATLLDADVDAWLVTNRSNLASLVTKLAEMTGTFETQAASKPLRVVATA